MNVYRDIDAFESALRADWVSRGWDPSGSSLLLCVSGGADSVALLHVCRRLAPGFRCRLSVVHVDHRLRPESAADADWVARACAELEVPLRVYVLDPSSRRAGESVEMWARRERYARFDSAAADFRAAAVLTAHHRDDLVETFFQRLGRGTGPRGLASIPFRRGRIVRPLLDRSRAEIRGYASALGLSWREDASNADVNLDRNWYRHRYLPAVRAREPDLDARVAALAARISSIGPGLDALEAMDGLLRTDPEGLPFLDGGGFAERAAAADRESLRYWLQALARAAAASHGLPAPAVTPAMLRECLRQWSGPSGAVRMQIAPALAFVREKRGIRCVRAGFGSESGWPPGKKSCPPPAQRVILNEGSARVAWRWDGRTYSLTARRFPRPPDLEYPSTSEERAIFDADLISCTLLVRIRKDGDRFSPLGMQSRSRKLKTFFNEEKVPAALRDSLPIVVSCHPSGKAATTADGESEAYSEDDGAPEEGSAFHAGARSEEEIPAWIPGYGISGFFKVRGSTTHILELVMKCENP